MAKIQTIKNKDSVTIYPQTHTQAVYDANGKKLQEWMNDYLTAEETATIEDINSTFETLGNKTTIVNSDSTDTQYPSAKAVYTAIINNIDAGFKVEILANGIKPVTPDTKTIYLIATESEEANNTYEEWMYVVGRWELIGTTKIDLSSYATKDMLTEYVKQEVLISYATNLSVDTKLADYSTTAIVDEKLASYTLSTTTEKLSTAHSQLDESFHTHTTEGFDTETGVHGMRYQDNNLEILNTTSFEWETVESAITKEYIDNKITYGTTTLEDGVSELATGTLYVVYEE